MVVRLGQGMRYGTGARSLSRARSMSGSMCEGSKVSG